MRVSIYGSSDDLTEIRITERGKREEEELCNSADDSVHAVIAIGTEDAGLVVRNRYASGQGSVWNQSVEPWEEDAPLPDWRVTYAAEHPYSGCLSVDCPDGTPVEAGLSDGGQVTRYARGKWTQED